MKMARLNKINLNKYQKFIFPTILVLLIVAVAISFALVSSASQIELNEGYYQYSVDGKRDYAEGTKVKLEKDYLNFKTEEGLSTGDISPIYADVNDKMILAEDMYWLNVANGMEYRIPALTTMAIDQSGAVICTSGKENRRIEGGFLGSAKGLYIFLETINLNWGTNQAVVGPLSFISYDASQGTRVYDYENKKIVTDENLEQTNYAQSSLGYSIDITAGIYTAKDGSKKLLIGSPKVLPSVFGN